MSAPLLTGCTDGITPKGGGKPCGGQVSWTKADHWHGKCARCSLTTRASSGDAIALDKRAEEQASG